MYIIVQWKGKEMERRKEGQTSLRSNSWENLRQGLRKNDGVAKRVIGWGSRGWASTDGSSQAFWWERADGLKRAHSRDTVGALLLWWELSCDMSMMQNLCFPSPRRKLVLTGCFCSALSNRKHVLIKKCYKYIYVKHIYLNILFMRIIF